MKNISVKKLLIFLLILFLILVAVLIGVPAVEHIGSDKVEGSADWMSMQSGNVLLSELNIPGTHDSATQYVQLPFFSKCQSMDIRTQLEDGYRYLDIRLGIEDTKSGKKLALMHGFTYCRNGFWPFSGHLYLESVLEDCYGFLDEHPGETIIFVVKKEHGEQSIEEFQNCLNSYVSQNENCWLLADEMPTLEQARGKLVLVRRYEDEAKLGARAGLPIVWENQPGHEDVSLSADIVEGNEYSVYVQDRYEYNVDGKWKAFESGIDIEKGARTGDVRLNFLSTKGTLAYGHPFFFAKRLNERFMDKGYRTPKGWTIVDFGTAELAKKIYSSNSNNLYSGLSYELFSFNERIQKGEVEPIYSEFSEESIYTFLQGPKSWEAGENWSGAWCYEYLEGNYFGAFGCGMCCMANIYDTLADSKASPLDAYYFAREMSAYQPNSKTGAIGWGDLKNCLRKMGMVCDLYYKPDSYEDFQKEMSLCKSMIVLVTSNEDDTFWKHTNGHYVNIWAYDKATDKVFLAEPGSPTNNRKWIPLRYVYDALKTISKFQYIRIDGYNEENDRWHPTGIDADWVMPSYLERINN